MAEVSEVFDAAMAIMDELSESGAAQTADTEEYKNRTVPIVNTLIAEVYPYSETKKPEARSSAWRPVEAFDDTLQQIDNTLALGVMPYGLASALLVDENPEASDRYKRRYEELLQRHAAHAQAECEQISDVYGGIGYGEFGSW